MARSPLFDIFDPDGLLAQQNMLLPDDDEVDVFAAVDRKPQLSDLMPKEEKSGLLSSLAQMGLSGLATAGYLLDTPGALVRGILAGDPLSVFGSSDDRVTGRELLRQYGMIGDEDTWGNFAGGLAGEVLLDPLTYMNPFAILGRGAYTQAGKALQATGRLRNPAVDAYRGFDAAQNAAARGRGAVDRAAGVGKREYLRGLTPRQALAEAPDYAEALARWQTQAQRFGIDPNDLDAPVAGLMDVRLPGTNIGFNVGGGATGDRIAQFLDRAGEASKSNPYTGPLVSGAAALFTADAGKSLDPATQWSSRIAKDDARLANEATDLLRTRQLVDAVRAQVPDTAMINGVQTAIPENLRQFRSTDLQRALADYAESAPLSGKTSGDAVADWVLENVPEFRAIRDDLVNLGATARADAEAIGLRLPDWQGMTGEQFVPRQLKWWERTQAPVRPNAAARVQRPSSRGERVLNTTDNFGRSRREYTDIPGAQRTFRALTGNADSRLDSAALQQALLAAPDERAARRLLDQAFDTIGVDRPYRQILRNLQADPAFQAATPAVRRQMQREAVERIRGNQDELVDFLRDADLQFARNRTGVFDTPVWENMRRYESGRNVVTANANQIVARLQEAAQRIPAGNVPGGGMLSIDDAARRLGFDPDNFRAMWQTRFGYDPAAGSVPERLVQNLGSLAPASRLADAERGLVSAADQFTNAFKVGALASPAFHVRNLYSGLYSGMNYGLTNPLDAWAAFRASQGNYGAIARRLENAPGFQNLAPEERVRRFLAMTGGQRIGQGSLLDDVTGLPEQSIRGTFTGGGTDDRIGTAARELVMGRQGRSWQDFLGDFFSLRGVGLTRQPRSRNTNPLLRVNDAVGSGVEDTLRTGSFLNQIRKGVDPGQAADLVRMSQIDYSPQAFSEFERNVMKRLMPFYSFQRGVLPSIADHMLYRPGGLQGQTIRAVTRGTEPSEDNFVPEHLRQSAAIPLPEGWPSLLGGEPAEGLRRYLTNIDLPFESTLNLFTPGVGSSLSSRITDSLQKTASNLLGQTNPLIKAPIEYITNRQLYTGRELSDLYSILEQDIGPLGRPLEQAVVNFVPFGARGISLYRQLSDDRLNPVDARMKAAFNILAGVKLTDVDEERSKRMAARNMLNSILETTPGVRTYENLTVPEDALRAMPAEQRRLYLLYRVLQSEAAQKARDKKKALDPLQVLGAVR